MPRGVGYESLAALVDYLTKEEEDRQVSLSALADAARQGIGRGVVDPVVDFVGAGQLGAEAPTDQPAQGFGDFRRQAGRGMTQLGEDIRGSRSMQARDPMEEIATIPGHLLANTLQGAGYLTQFGKEEWERLKTAAGTVAEEAMDPKYIEGGWVRPAVEAVQPYVEEPYKIAQEMSIGDVLPGAGLLAKIGMAVPMGLAAKVPAMKMGKTAAKAVEKPDMPDPSAAQKIDHHDLVPIPDDKIDIWHNGPEGDFTGVDESKFVGNTFDGVFGNAGGSSHMGRYSYRLDIPQDAIMDHFDFTHRLPYEKTQAAVKKVADDNSLSTDDEFIEDFWDYIAEEKLVQDLHDYTTGELDESKIYALTGEFDAANGGWKMQQMRGQVAKELGYSAVEMQDEYGISTLVIDPKIKPSVRKDTETGEIISLGAAKASVEPPRRSLLERLAEGVEDPGALERGRLEGGDKVLRPGYDEDHHDKLLRQLNEAAANNDTEAIKKIDAELSAIVEPVTPEIEGQRISQLAALDALDPVEKARLDRAVEQGFDLDGFHGTKGDIEAFDPGLLGETTGAPSARMGYFFAADPETAQTYARTSKLEDVRPSITNREQELIDRVYELEAAGDWEGAAKATEAAEAFSLSLTNQTGQNIIPVKLRLQNPLEHDFKGEGYRDVSYQTLLENAKNKGHDGAIFRNTTDGAGMTDIYVVFEPAQIRSRYAAFDPKDTPTTGLRQNAKLANEALQVNRKQLEVLVKRKKAVEREYSDLWAVSGIFNKKAELALAEKKSPALREDMLELSNNIKALQDRMDLLEDEARKVTIGTGDVTASFAPVVLPLGAGTAAAAYLANQEQE